jgi:hypothetical protein
VIAEWAAFDAASAALVFAGNGNEATAFLNEQIENGPDIGAPNGLRGSVGCAGGS